MQCMILDWILVQKKDTRGAARGHSWTADGLLDLCYN
jgi:hypothetical protein